MSRRKVPMSFTLSPETITAISGAATAAHMNRSKFVEHALTEFMRRYTLRSQSDALAVPRDDEHSDL